MAARAIWKGVIVLGRVKVPVRIYSAVEDRDVQARRSTRDRSRPQPDQPQNPAHPTHGAKNAAPVPTASRTLEQRRRKDPARISMEIATNDPALSFIPRFAT